MKPAAPPPDDDAFIKDPTDDDYATAARWALKNKDFPLALQQAAAAVSIRPLHEPHTALLDDIIATAKGPLALLKLPETGAFFGLCAARARALARFDRIDEALGCLFQATSFSPTTPFLPWAVDWLSVARTARGVDTNTLAARTLLFLAAASDQDPTDGLRLNLEAAIAIADKVLARQSPAPHLVVAQSRVFRALGRREEALARLGGGDATAWEIAVERAAIHRELGDPAAQIHWLERARAARPEDGATLLDLGDAYLDDGRLELAVDTYAHAEAAKGPQVAWASPSLAYAKALAAGHYARIEAPPDAPPEAASHARLLDADLAAYLVRLAEPLNPLSGVLRGAAARAASPEAPAKLTVRVRANRPLAPSARVAFLLAMKRAGKEGELLVDSERKTGRMGPISWEAAPAPEGLLARVSELAASEFAWEAWCLRAKDIARELGDAVTMEAIGAAMAHPSTPPSPAADAVLWVHAFQVAGAVILAAARGAEPLFPLLDGVDDWSSAAAILGLHAVAQADAHAREGIVARLRELLPGRQEPLPIYARALAITGCELATGDARRDYLVLRARIRRDLVERAAARPPP